MTELTEVPGLVAAVECPDCEWAGERGELVVDQDAEGPVLACPDCGAVLSRDLEDRGP